MELTESKNNSLLGCSASRLEALPLYQIIPFRIIIHNILPYLQYKYDKNSNFDVKTLFGYFKSELN